MSDIGELRRIAAEASAEFDRAQNAAGFARTSQRNWATAVTQWKLSHTGEDREPLPIIQGNARYDIPMQAPPTGEEVVALEKAVGKADRKLDKATKALTDAAAAGAPRRKPSTTGWAATRSFRFLGTHYDVGDEFDPGIAEPAKFAKLIGSRMIAAISPAGVDHGS
jgi:hypothetical protein